MHNSMEVSPYSAIELSYSENNLQNNKGNIDTSRTKELSHPTIEKAHSNNNLSHYQMNNSTSQTRSPINEILRDEKIGVLTLQETHLTDEHVKDIHNIYNKCMHIYHSADPQQLNAKGVAIVLNKEITNTQDVDYYEIIPGRAIMIKLPWHHTLTITILTVYAPNDPTENKQFWESLLNTWNEKNLPIPDFMLGDTNIVEEMIDRLPCHRDSTSATQALSELKSLLQLKDGWRETNPTSTAFTYMQLSTGSQSRIDRIYIANELASSCRNWSIKATHIPTDHKLVTVELIDLKAPYIGCGRWTMPLYLLKNKKLIKEIQDLGLEMESQIEKLEFNECTETRNAQILYKEFKDQMIQKIKAFARKATPKLT
ncbi:Endonuclease/exonuclease/phosphatase [Armillaria borealis]|uniref:Endonuclease/exonuclease/phosphatase n=1 Tax=Armillaria borealis TaxID=47425 RepID=A0AA39ME03_9AGAR|nr:Endonuclease/exonuclease/phosphatase [Armillaria borealis]